MTYALISIGPLGHERLLGEYTRRSEALRARDDLFEQNGGLRKETYRVYDQDGEQEWDDEHYCPDCQDVLTKGGRSCAECVSEQASYYMPDQGGQS